MEQIKVFFKNHPIIKTAILFIIALAVFVGIMVMIIRNLNKNKSVNAYNNEALNRAGMKEKQSNKKMEYITENENKEINKQKKTDKEKTTGYKDLFTSESNKKAKTRTKSKNIAKQQKEEKSNKTNKKTYTRRKTKRKNVDYFNEYKLGTETSKNTYSSISNKSDINSNKTYIKAYIKNNYNFEYGKEKEVIAVTEEKINKKIPAGAIIYGKAKIDLKAKRIYIVFYKLEYGNKQYNINAKATELDKTKGLYANIDENKAENLLKALGNKTIEMASSFNPASDITSNLTDKVKMKMSNVTAKISKRKGLYIKM